MEVLEGDEDVPANDELKALIKITSPSFPRQPGLGRTDPFNTLSAKGPIFDFLIQHSKSASSLIHPALRLCRLQSNMRRRVNC